MRTTLGKAATFVYISSYGNGTIDRLVYKFIYGYSAFKFYINGTSDSMSTIYVRDELTAQSVAIRIIPLDSMTPNIIPVSAIPSDAVGLAIN